jgi:hypothetical protein
MSKTLFEHYKEIANKHNGSCKVKKTASGIGGMNAWKVILINLPYKNGEIHFEISETSPIKIDYEFSNKLNLEFLIYPEDWLDKIGKLFGLEEHEIGIKEFDKKFIIKGSNKRFVSRILDKQTREFLLNNDALSNCKLETIKDKSILELRAPFNQTNLTKLELTIEFIKKMVDNINGYNENNNR